MSSKSKNHEKGGKPKDTRVEVLVRGIKLKVEPEIVTDFDIADMIDDVNSGNVFRIPKLFKAFFGERSNEILDKLRGEKGTLSIDTASEFLLEVLEQVNPNSSGSQSSTGDTKDN